MNPAGWSEIGLAIGLSVLAGWLLSPHLARVWKGERTVLNRVLGPIERLIYRLGGVDPADQQTLGSYVSALIVFSFLGIAILFGLFVGQGALPLNPARTEGMSAHLALNTAISFVTNTSWQSYSGEVAMGHLGQMAGITTQAFLSAAVGLAVASVIARAMAADRQATVGNFWVDVTRNTLFVLLPMAVVLALIYLALGVPQTLVAVANATTLEGGLQAIALAPSASQEAIKQISSDCGSAFNVNSAHPFTNPTPLTNLIQMASMTVLGFAGVFAFGRIVVVRRQALVLTVVMVGLLSLGTGVIYVAEAQTPPALVGAGIIGGGNMEGKETRFGVASSAAFAGMTTGASCGGVNAMMDSFNSAGMGTALVLMMLGEILPGGPGSGLYGLLMMVFLTVFVAGLMIGRTPEFLGKKIESREMQWVMLATLALPVATLVFAAIAAVLPVARESLLNEGARGYSEILYAYASSTANNGSALAGLNANTPWWNLSLAVVMMIGRFVPIIAVLALAAAIAAKPRMPDKLGILPTGGLQFVILLTAVILIMGGLQYIPSLVLGPVLEHIEMQQALVVMKDGAPTAP